MELMAIIGDSVQYIEDHITEDISAENVAKAVGVSPFYFQKGFAMLCGFSVAEYIRNRRLALAGNDLLITDDKVIDIAMKYGYDSPDSFAKLNTAMTKEGKFKDAIQDKIGATVDTTDLEKQLSVLNASLHQAETIKTRLEQQMDNLDVTETHYEKKISDLQRRLDAQYDKIDEVEVAITELKSQIYEMKKNQIDAESIYQFLGAFNELYSECTDAEKKQFMQAFIERIDIFPERREDGNWIRNIKFQFPVPIIRDGKEVIRIDGISLGKEQSGEHTVSLEKLSTLETVCLLSKQK